jgi:hypothetical protein
MEIIYYGVYQKNTDTQHRETNFWMAQRDPKPGHAKLMDNIDSGDSIDSGDDID